VSYTSDGKIKVPSGATAINVIIDGMSLAGSCGYLSGRTYTSTGDMIGTITIIADEDLPTPGSGFTCGSPTSNSFYSIPIGSNVDSIAIIARDQPGWDISATVSIQSLTIEFITTIIPSPPPPPLSIVFTNVQHIYRIPDDIILPSHAQGVVTFSEVIYTPDGKIKVPSGATAINVIIDSMSLAGSCGYLSGRTYTSTGDMIGTITIIADEDLPTPGSGFTCGTTSPTSNSFYNIPIGSNVDSIVIIARDQPGWEINANISIQSLTIEFV
jgi:hypothetical protein